MKTNKWVALLLVFLLMLPVFAPPSAQAAEIEVGTWEELATALNGASSGDTIRLKNSIYGQVTSDMPTDYTDETAYTSMQITGDCTLDLNGFTIGGASGSNDHYLVMLAVGNSGDVTIKNGTLSAPDIDLVFYNGGHAVLENVTIEGHHGIVNAGDLILDRTTYNSTYGMIQMDGSLRITDSVVTARNGSAVQLFAIETTRIESGTFTGQPVFAMDQPTVTLKDFINFDQTFLIEGDTMHDQAPYPDMKHINGTIQLISAYPITVDPQDALQVHMAEWIDHYPEGWEVEVDVAMPAGKTLTSLTLNGTDITDQVVASDGSAWAYVAFTMPGEAVVLKATYDGAGKAGHALTLDPVANLKADQTDLTNIPKDTDVTVTVTPPVGKALETLKANGIDVTALVKEGTYTFKMPEKDMALTATFIDVEAGYLISVFTIDKQEMRINENGKDRTERLDVAPYIRNNRTMLPVRFVGQSLNMEVTFDETTRDVLVQDATRSVKLNLDSNVVTTGASNKPYILDSKPEVIAGRTMLPIGEIANILGFSRTDQNHPGGYLTWDGDARTVTIMVQTPGK